MSLVSGTALSDLEIAIIADIRAPRVLLGIAVGVALGVSGACLQALFRNPLADPGIIGVSAGGSLAAATVIVLGDRLATTALGGVIAAAGTALLPLAAFAGSLGAMALVYAIARRSGDSDAAILILAGIAVGAAAQAGIGVLSFMADDQQLRTLNFWLFGSLGRATWAVVIPVGAVILIATPALLHCARKLDAYALGEREAAHLGIDVKRLKRRIIVLTAVVVGASVSVSGIIGFVGLAVPHLIRLISGPDNAVVLPASALLGAILMLLADIIARTSVAPAELPIGILTALLGAPFFIWLLRRQSAGLI